MAIKEADGASNGSLTARSYPPGIHVPVLTFFQDDERQEVDWALQAKHLEYLISSGLHGIVLAGTNGEAVTLSVAEKAKLVRTARQIAVGLGKPDFSITVGCVGQCTRDVITQTREAREAGGDFALVLVPSYFHFAMTEESIIDFFEELADSSPIPVIIYNFPNVAAGLDLNSEMLCRLGKHRNIAGVKLTCGGIAKVARLASLFPAQDFCVLAGQSDWLVPALRVGGVGSITGVANLYPQVFIELYELWCAGKHDEAAALQLEISTAEWGIAKGGVSGTKWVVAKILGYPTSASWCRRPYPRYADQEKQEWILKMVSTLGAKEAALAGRRKL